MQNYEVRSGTKLISRVVGSFLCFIGSSPGVDLSIRPITTGNGLVASPIRLVVCPFHLMVISPPQFGRSFRRLPI